MTMSSPPEDTSGVTAPSPRDSLPNPFLERLGAEQTAWRDGFAEFRLAIDPSLLNRQGMLQGGVLATLLDAACGYAGLFSDDPQRPRHGVTLSLTLNYLAPGNGSVVVARGYVERRGNRVYFSRGEVWLDGVELIATAQGTFKYMSAQLNGARKTARIAHRVGLGET